MFHTHQSFQRATSQTRMISKKFADDYSTSMHESFHCQYQLPPFPISCEYNVSSYRRNIRRSITSIIGDDLIQCKYCRSPCIHQVDNRMRTIFRLSKHWKAKTATMMWMVCVDNFVLEKKNQSNALIIFSRKPLSPIRWNNMELRILLELIYKHRNTNM